MSYREFGRNYPGYLKCAPLGVPIVVEQEATILFIAPGKVLKRQEFEEHGKGTDKLGGRTADTVYASCSLSV